MSWRKKSQRGEENGNATSVRKETHVVSVLIEHLETDAIRDKKDNRPVLHQKRRHRLTKRNSQKVQVAEGKVLVEPEAEFRADISLGESVRTRHVITGTLSCVSVTSLNQDANMANADFDTLRLMGSPVKKSRRTVV